MKQPTILTSWKRKVTKALRKSIAKTKWLLINGRRNSQISRREIQLNASIKEIAKLSVS